MENIFKKNIGSGKEGYFEADKVTKKELLGAGSYALVFKVEVEKAGHKKNFALKEYGPRLKKATERALTNYLHAKDIGLKVFPTVRINEDHTKLLLTLGATEDSFLISGDSKEGENKVDSIENLPSLIQGLQEDILKASKKSVHYAGDAIFLIGNKDKPNHLDFILGDYDNLMEYDTDVNLFPENVVIARNTLKKLLSSYVDENKTVEYNAEIDKSFYDFYHKEKNNFFCTEDNVFEAWHGLK